MRIDLPYGKDCIKSVDVPDRNLLGVLSPPRMDKQDDQVKAIEEALRNPVGDKTLEGYGIKGVKSSCDRE